VIDEEQVKALVGTVFPGGTITIEAWEHRLMCDTLLVEPPADGTAHPFYAYQATRAGMGLDLDEMFALCLADPDDGGMFGEHEAELDRPLRVGETYAVRGSITDVERKQGRTAGTFDMITFRLELLDDRGRRVATARNKWIFPRRES